MGGWERAGRYTLRANFARKPIWSRPPHPPASHRNRRLGNFRPNPSLELPARFEIPHAPRSGLAVVPPGLPRGLKSSRPQNALEPSPSIMRRAHLQRPTRLRCPAQALQLEFEPTLPKRVFIALAARSVLSVVAAESPARSGRRPRSSSVVVSFGRASHISWRTFAGARETKTNGSRAVFLRSHHACLVCELSFPLSWSIYDRPRRRSCLAHLFGPEHSERAWREEAYHSKRAPLPGAHRNKRETCCASLLADVFGILPDGAS